jgi:hypothetical protein
VDLVPLHDEVPDVSTPGSVVPFIVERGTSAFQKMRKLLPALPLEALPSPQLRLPTPLEQVAAVRSLAETYSATPRPVSVPAASLLKYDLQVAPSWQSMPPKLS